jgi:hypothetical protein
MAMPYSSCAAGIRLMITRRKKLAMLLILGIFNGAISVFVAIILFIRYIPGPTAGRHPDTRLLNIFRNTV